MDGGRVTAGLLPPFNEHGLLPPGDYPLTLEDLAASHLVTGLDSTEPWARKWRGALVRNLSVLAAQLWAVGIENIFINGSFVENKIKPHDIDGYFECKLLHLASGDLENELNALDPLKCWTWSRKHLRPDASSTKMQLPMWHLYHVDLWPHTGGLSSMSGIRDEHGHELQFPAAFRRQRDTGLQKGIIKLLPTSGKVTAHD